MIGRQRSRASAVDQRINVMAASTNVSKELAYSEILEYMQKSTSDEIQICQKLDRPLGGDVFVCVNTAKGTYSVFVRYLPPVAYGGCW